MGNYLYKVEEEITPDEKQKRLRHELMKQIRLSNLKLKHYANGEDFDSDYCTHHRCNCHCSESESSTDLSGFSDTDDKKDEKDELLEGIHEDCKR